MTPRSRPNSRPAVLAYLEAHPEGVTTLEVAAACGINKCTAFKHLRALATPASYDRTRPFRYVLAFKPELAVPVKLWDHVNMNPWP